MEFLRHFHIQDMFNPFYNDGFTPLGGWLIAIFLLIIIAVSVNRIRKFLLLSCTYLRFFIHINFNEKGFETWLYKQPYEKRKDYTPIIKRVVVWPRKANVVLARHYVLTFTFLIVMFVFGFWGWQNIKQPFIYGEAFISGEEGYKLHKDALTKQIKKCAAIEDVSVETIAGCSAPIAQPTLELRNVLLGLVALLALPFFFVRMWITERNTKNAEQSHMTERINEAVKNLGSEKTGRYEEEEITKKNIEVRIGALLALERISIDSARDHWAVMEILTNYLKENSPAEKAVQSKLWDDIGKEAFLKLDHFERLDKSVEWRKTLSKPDPDIQMVMRILGRRSLKDRYLSLSKHQYLDLRNLNLQNIDIQGLHFDHAQFQRSHLQGADLRGAHLEGADLRYTHLEGADLFDAHLEGADLRYAHLEGAHLLGAHFEGADLSYTHLEGANLEGAYLQGADLSYAHLEGAHLFDTHLEGAELLGAHLKGANIQVTDLSQCR